MLMHLFKYSDDDWWLPRSFQSVESLHTGRRDEVCMLPETFVGAEPGHRPGGNGFLDPISTVIHLDASSVMITVQAENLWTAKRL